MVLSYTVLSLGVTKHVFMEKGYLLLNATAPLLLLSPHTYYFTSLYFVYICILSGVLRICTYISIYQRQHNTTHLQNILYHHHTSLFFPIAWSDYVYCNYRYDRMKFMSAFVMGTHAQRSKLRYSCHFTSFRLSSASPHHVQVCIL